MCGISGIVNKNNSIVSSTPITKMTDLISHRGPDGSGYFYGPNFAFGHRRLSIIDLSEAGHQPMEVADNYVITYNGEVYNYIEIRNQLESIGYSFKSQTDTEVIVAAYDFWGENCVNHFNGMWSFAIFDKRKNILFCSRDRFGIKPFYYSNLHDKFVFGSEIKQILCFFNERFVNRRMLIDYLVSGYSEHTNETMFGGVYSLPGGHNLIYDLSEHKFQINLYYELKVNGYVANLDEKSAVDKYRTEFVRSVNYRLRSDVKVGTCLSGGLDSSSVAAVASILYPANALDKFNAIHARSSEQTTDESVYAKEVAKACNIDLKIITPTVGEFKTLLDEVIYTQEEPFGGPSVCLQYFVMKKAKKVGCKVLLDGQGGDETLLGYERYYASYIFSQGYNASIPSVLKACKHSKLSLTKLLSYIGYFLIPTIRTRRLKSRNYFLRRECFDNFDFIFQSAQAFRSIKDLQRLEIFKLQLPHLLRYEDKNSMRNSIETRLPFLDYKLLETAFSINDAFKIKNGWTKHILRKAINKSPSYLPNSVIWRRNKFGFNAPEKTWISAIKAEMMQSISNSNILGAITIPPIRLAELDNRTLWRLFSIARWEKIYEVKY